MLDLTPCSQPDTPTGEVSEVLGVLCVGAPSRRERDDGRAIAARTPLPRSIAPVGGPPRADSTRRAASHAVQSFPAAVATQPKRSASAERRQ